MVKKNSPFAIILSISRISLIISLCLTSCENGTKNKTKVALRDIVNGVWYYQERDSSYAEFVIVDNVDWGYDERAGIVERDIRIVGDTIINRYYAGTDHLFGYWKIVDATPGSLLVVSSFGGYKFKLRRLNLDVDISRLVGSDTALVDSYINGYRSRKMAWKPKKP